MTVTLNLPPEMEAAFEAQAQARGLSLEEWMLEIAGQYVQPASIAHLQKTNPREWARQFRQWADSHDPSAPVLTDDAMSRESIYPDLTYCIVLIDTSVLLRTVQVRHPQHETVTRALETLPGRGRELHIVPQNLIEFWVVATRPIEQNGLGMTPAAVVTELGRIKSMFRLLPETPAIYSVWERPRHSISHARKACA